VRDWKLIRGGVDLSTFAPGSRHDARRELGFATDEHIILHVSQLGPTNPRKDFSTIRQALIEIGHLDPTKRVLLLAIGADGPEERIAPGIVVRRAGYESSRARLAQFYRAADVLVHAALGETFGLAVAEALACGLPVVTASTGGVHEIVQHGRSGLIVPPRDPPRLADALLQLLDEPERRAAMGRAAADFARDHLDRRVMVAALHAWCEEIYARWNAEAYGTPRPELAH
jgi:glycosyltransferase involved in cell wall biosynthesis